MSCLSTRGPDLPHHTNMTATVRSNPTVNPAANPRANEAATSHEGFWRRLRRRLLTVPLVFAVTILFVAALPLLLLVAALIDLLRGPLRGRLVLCRGLLFFATFLLLESAAIVGVTLLWLVHLILRDEAFFVRANRAAQTWWSTTLYRSGEYFFSLRTHIEGSLPPPDPEALKVPPLLVFVRHASTADTVLPVVLLATRGYRLRYVLKRELLLDPCLDIVGQRLRNYFVARGGKETEQDLLGVDALAADLGSGDALVIYPEGTRFTAAKRARILTRLREQGPADTLALADSLTQTLPPLQRGPLRLLERNRTADLLLIGHVGLDAAGSLGELLQGELVNQDVRIHIERIPFAELPQDPLAQRQLLADKWRQIDAFIAHHKARPKH